MRSTTTVLFLLAAAVLLGQSAVADPIDAVTAFERLKSLEGTWRGNASGEGEAEAEAQAVEEIVHEFRVASGGTVVMETMGVGTSEEMINMYHLEGDDLVVTHYCSSGNQPKMRLNTEASAADHLVFDFAGGSGFDPAVDNHIHDAVLDLLGSGRLDSSWSAQEGGETIGVMRFHLEKDS